MACDAKLGAVRIAFACKNAGLLLWSLTSWAPIGSCALEVAIDPKTIAAVMANLIMFITSTTSFSLGCAFNRECQLEIS
jgi:hypothetical protein